MKIGLLQVDGKFPNVALMQITAYHEQRGDEVLWFESGLFAPKYDKVYVSKIFDFSPMRDNLPPDALIGGTGIDHTNTLPPAIAECSPSYALYPDCNYHIGFSMKGCRFACKFCCVPKKEGRPRLNSTIDDLLINPRGQNRLMLLDNDFFGGQAWRENLERIIELDLRVSFVQGLNIRILTDEQAAMLAKCRYQNASFDHHYVTFAWDRYQDGKRIFDGIERCVRAGIPTKAMQFFVLIGYDTTPEQDLERVTRLRDAGCTPYVMPFNKQDPYQKRFARWVNHRAIFKTVAWEDYRHTVAERRNGLDQETS